MHVAGRITNAKFSMPREFIWARNAVPKLDIYAFILRSGYLCGTYNHFHDLGKAAEKRKREKEAKKKEEEVKHEENEQEFDDAEDAQEPEQEEPWPEEEGWEDGDWAHKGNPAKRHCS